MIKAVIFDLDGVLVSTDKLHYEAWSVIAHDFGLPFSPEINNQLRGVSRMESLEILMGDKAKLFGDQEKLEMANFKNKLYRESLAQLTPEWVPQDVREVLKKLHQMNIILAVGSSSKNAREIIDRIGLAGDLQAISDGNNISASKPDPEVFLKAAEMIDLPPSDCLVIEDAVSGVEAAIRGNFKCCWLQNSLSPNHKFPSEQVHIIDSITAIIDIISLENS